MSIAKSRGEEMQEEDENNRTEAAIASTLSLQPNFNSVGLTYDWSDWIFLSSLAPTFHGLKFHLVLVEMKVFMIVNNCLIVSTL